MAEVFKHIPAESTKMEPVLRSTQVLKQGAEGMGLMGKDVAGYVTRQQTLDREERAWRDAQKREVDIRMAELQAEEKKRAEENQIQMAQIEAAREQAKI